MKERSRLPSSQDTPHIGAVNHALASEHTFQIGKENLSRFRGEFLLSTSERAQMRAAWHKLSTISPFKLHLMEDSSDEWEQHGKAEEQLLQADTLEIECKHKMSMRDLHVVQDEQFMHMRKNPHKAGKVQRHAQSEDREPQKATVVSPKDGAKKKRSKRSVNDLEELTPRKSSKRAHKKLSRREIEALQANIDGLNDEQLERVLEFLSPDLGAEVEGVSDEVHLNLDTLLPLRQRALVKFVNAELRSMQNADGLSHQQGSIGGADG